MPIRIKQNLSAAQDGVRLPFRVDLSQVLATFTGSESVTLEYWLDAGHDVYFQGGRKDGEVRQEKISFVDTPIAHRVSLEHGAGAEVDNVVIHQKLTDASGHVQRDFDLTSVSIRRD